MHLQENLHSSPYRFLVRYEGNFEKHVQRTSCCRFVLYISFMSETCFCSWYTTSHSYRAPEEMSSASSIAGGPVRESSYVRKFLKKHDEQNWVGS